MKGLGLTGAAIGGASALSVPFNDLDEAMSLSAYSNKRAWWVKQRDDGNPTLEIDWKQIKRRDLRGFPNWNFTLWPGYDSKDHETKYEEFSKTYWPDYPGESIRSKALYNAGFSLFRYPSPYVANLDQFGIIPPNKVATPESAGYAKWQGTPEENLATVRAALSMVGIGPIVGVVEVDDKMKNTVWSYNHTGLKINFEDGITQSSITQNPRVYHVPNTFRWAIVANNFETTELIRGGKASSTGSFLSYTRVSFAKQYMELFLNGLGYNCAYSHYMQPATIWGIMAGNGEHSRMAQVCLSPEFGNFPRTHFIMYTDLPLPVTKPIDAGIMRFCEDCGHCADQCPKDAIPKKEIGPNWEPFTGQSWENDRESGGKELMWNIPGFKGWRANLYKCQGGSHCRGACPFNAIPNGSFVHSTVKSTIATTPLLNGFFANMENVMHYAKEEKNPEAWWSQPESWYMYGANPELFYQK
jgi:reductive dehalogenase